jgi:hypothetical protein
MPHKTATLTESLSFGVPSCSLHVRILFLRPLFASLVPWALTIITFLISNIPDLAYIICAYTLVASPVGMPSSSCSCHPPFPFVIPRTQLSLSLSSVPHFVLHHFLQLGIFWAHIRTTSFSPQYRAFQTQRHASLYHTRFFFSFLIFI